MIADALKGIWASWILVFPAEWKLGTRLKPGKPEERTELETKGIYKYTRHPIYLGAYLFGIASLLYSPSWHNSLFLILIITIHTPHHKRGRKTPGKNVQRKMEELQKENTQVFVVLRAPRIWCC